MKKNSIIASLGSILEYFDFALFGLMAGVFGKIFFDPSNPIASEIKFVLTYFIGFFARPIGGICAGFLGDIKGRKKVFVFLTLLMSISTFLIGCLPTYSQIGIWSPILLVMMRVLQGVSFGGEIVGAAVIIKESESEKKKHFGISLLISSTCIGAVLANGSIAILYAFFENEILSYAWRIPFIVAGIFGFIIFFLRKNLSETINTHENKIDNSFKKIITEIFLKKKLLISGIIFSLFTFSLLITNIFYPVILNSLFNIPLGIYYSYTTYSLIFGIFLSPIISFFLKYISKEKLMIIFFSLYAISARSLFSIFEKNFSELYLFIFLMIQQIFIAVFYTCQMGIFLDNIPSKIRYSTKAIIANISSAIASLIPILYRGEKAKFYHKSTPEILIIILVFSFISLVIFKKNSEKN